MEQEEHVNEHKAVYCHQRENVYSLYILCFNHFGLHHNDAHAYERTFKLKHG